MRVNGTDFTSYSSTIGWGAGPGLSRYSLTAGGMEAVPHVPSGAIIDYVEFDFCDSNAGADVTLNLYDCGPLGTSCSTSVSSLASSGSPGCTSVSNSAIGYPVSNAGSSFDFEVQVGASDGTLAVGSAVIGYRLQVSPAPVTPTFTDVPTDSIYYQFIEALAASGVTGGCDVGLYCPDRNITRAEMAVFLAKSLGLHFPN